MLNQDMPTPRQPGGGSGVQDLPVASSIIPSSFCTDTRIMGGIERDALPDDGECVVSASSTAFPGMNVLSFRQVVNV